MKRFINATLCALLFACGAPVEDDHRRIVEDDGSETVALINRVDEDVEKAYSRPAGYGADEGKYECAGYEFWDGACLTPRSKTVKYNQYCSSSSSNVTNGFLSAINEWVSVLQAKGWTVEYESGDSAPSNGLKVLIRCDMPSGYTSPTDGLIGVALLTHWSSNNLTENGYPIRRFHRAIVGIDIPEITAKINSGYYGSCGNTCQRNIWHNSLLHELGHAGGFGHAFFGSVSSNVMAIGWPYSQAKVPFTSQQQGRLQTYSAN